MTALVNHAHAQDKVRSPDYVDTLKERIGRTFHCSKLGASKTAVLVAVNKNEVLLKRDLDAKDSFSLSLVKFAKFYSEVI